MAKKTAKSSPDALLDTALALIAGRGWRGFTLAHLAEAAGLPLAEIHARFPDRGALLDALVARIDRRMLENLGPPDLEAAPRDRLFEVAMARLDAMTPHKAAYKALAHDLGSDPIEATGGLLRLRHSLDLMCEAAGIDPGGVSGWLTSKGLGAVMVYTLRTWFNDDNEDMADTMAALDKALRQAEEGAGWLAKLRCSLTGRRKPADAEMDDDQPPPAGSASSADGPGAAA